MPVIGVFGMGPASSHASRIGGLRSGLRDLGYVEGRNVAIEFRWAEIPPQLGELAAELVKRQVDAIVCSGNATTRAAKLATRLEPDRRRTRRKGWNCCAGPPIFW
jgi:putative ABC transport system substrate-binding protein